jgi:hypothetical protein
LSEYYYNRGTPKRGLGTGAYMLGFMGRHGVFGHERVQGTREDAHGSGEARNQVELCCLVTAGRRGEVRAGYAGRYFVACLLGVHVDVFGGFREELGYG